MSGVEFNGHVSSITGTTSTTGAGSIKEENNLGIMGFGHGNSFSIGVTRIISGLHEVSEHFAAVPDFEYNSNGQNLVIDNKYFMPDSLEQQGFCEV